MDLRRVNIKVMTVVLVFEVCVLSMLGKVDDV